MPASPFRGPYPLSRKAASGYWQARHDNQKCLHDELRGREGITHSTLYISHCVSRVFKGRALRRGGSGRPGVDCFAPIRGSQ